MANMQLLSLPTEVLRHIIAETRLCDFENLLLTCKRVYDAGHLYIAEHNSRRRILEIKFTRKSFGENYSELVYGLVQVLRIVAINPAVARYVEHLTLRSVEEWDIAQTEMQFGDLHSFEDHQLEDDALLEDMIRECVWLQTAGCDLDLWTWVILGVGNPKPEIDEQTYTGVQPESLLSVLALVLTKLGNLKSLSIKCDMRLPGDYGPNDREMTSRSAITIEAWAVLQLMSLRVGKDSSHEEEETRINGPLGCSDDKRAATLRLASSLPVSPLENLCEIHYCTPTGYHQFTPAHCMNLFITSPSIRRLYATNLQAHSDQGGEYRWPTVWYDENGTGLEQRWEHDGETQVMYIDANTSSLLSSRKASAVEHLELVASCVDPQGIRDLLNSMPSLTSLRYTHEPKDLAIEFDFDAGWFLRAIADKNEDVEYDTRMNPVDFFNGSNYGDEQEEEEEQDEEEETSDPDNHDEEGEEMPEYDDGNDDDEDTHDHASQITEISIGFESSFFGSISTGISADTLQKFTALEILSLDVRLFLGPTPESCERRDEHEDGAADVQATRWNPETDTLRLIDVLPATLKELELFVPRDQRGKWFLHHWPQLLAGFCEGREEKLPDLTEFRVIESLSYGEDSKALYREISEAAGADHTLGCETNMGWRLEFGNREDMVYWD